MSMSAASTPSAQKLRVVTYNILTPNYATPRDLPVSITFP
jgi:mRNA deadenylase 3'-5' endonuclease subunit Ccr4